MVVSEQARFELHERRTQTLGNEAAATMTDLLPPVGWADVARRDDVERVKVDLKRVEESLRAEIVRLEEVVSARTEAVVHAEFGKLALEIGRVRDQMVNQNRALLLGLAVIAIAILVRTPGG